MRARPLPAALALMLLPCGLGPAAAPPPAAPPRVTVGPNVALEVEGKVRRVIITASVCLRQGRLEGLLTRSAKGKSKDHEYILAADVDARHLHAGLLLAGAKPGAPVRFEPKFAPPTGTRVRISLRYLRDGRKVTVPAGEWFRHVKTHKPLACKWVFAGSCRGPNPDRKDGPPYYMANHGAVISVCNVAAAVLDLPQRSPKAPNDRLWEAHTETIPPAGTRIEVILEPVVSRK